MGEAAGIVDALGAFLGNNGFPIFIALSLLGLVALMVWRDRGSTSVHQEVVRPETSAERDQATALHKIAKNTECLPEIERELSHINEKLVHATYALQARKE